MAHGAPDYGDVSNDGLIYRIDDLGELATRLKSPVTHDRRGNVIWLYDFADGLNGVGINFSGGGSTYALSADRFEGTPFSFVAKPGAGANLYTSVYNRVSTPSLCKVGFQASILVNGFIKYHSIQILYYDGTYYYDTTLTYDLWNKTLSVTAYDGETIVIDDEMPVLSGTNAFTHFKLVVDIATQKPVRAMWNRQAYDLSAYAMDKGDSELPEGLMVIVTAKEATIAGSGDYVDNLILTINEP